MKIFEISKKIEVKCESKDTRNGFKHTATLTYEGIEMESVKCCYVNRTWESYQYESVLKKLADKESTLSKAEKKVFAKAIKNGGNTSMEDLNRVANIAKLGDIFGKTQKESNDWKERMIKAGLENKGLIMPEDWDDLDEDTKQFRLDGAIKILGKK